MVELKWTSAASDVILFNESDINIFFSHAKKEMNKLQPQKPFVFKIMLIQL